MLEQGTEKNAPRAEEQAQGGDIPLRKEGSAPGADGEMQDRAIEGAGDATALEDSAALTLPDAMHGKQWAYFIPATVLTIAALAAVTVALVLGIETRMLFTGQGTPMLAAIVTIPMTLIFGVCGSVVALIALPLCRPLLRYAPRQRVRRMALAWFVLDIVAVVCAAVAIVLVFLPVV